MPVSPNTKTQLAALIHGPAQPAASTTTKVKTADDADNEKEDG